MEFDKNVCPVLNVDGVMATGKQYDLEINLTELLFMELLKIVTKSLFVTLLLS